MINYQEFCDIVGKDSLLFFFKSHKKHFWFRNEKALWNEKWCRHNLTSLDKKIIFSIQILGLNGFARLQSFSISFHIPLVANLKLLLLVHLNLNLKLVSENAIKSSCQV